MDVDEYRRAYAAELAKPQAPQADRFASMSALAQPSENAMSPETDLVAEAIAILANSSQPPAARLAALQNIQAVTFLGPKFDRYRASYRDALRVAATDPDKELRTNALELLAIDKDEVARDLLVKGLEDEQRALVSAAKAIQLLAYDDHGVSVPMAQKVLRENYDVDAKEEALRVLASDPASDEVFARFLSDQSQPARLRSISASGLRMVNPQRFEQEAHRIIVDESEDDSVRENCLGALAHMQGYAARVDANFADKLTKLKTTSKSESLRAAATRFLQTRDR